MSKRILVVDDDDNIRDVLQLLLASEGYEVDTAADGLIALHKLEHDPKPHLVLLDLMMPRMDGETLLREIEQREWRTTLPILVLSAHILRSQKTDQLKVNGFISKPFEIDDVLDRVAALL